VTLESTFMVKTLMANGETEIRIMIIEKLPQDLLSTFYKYLTQGME